MSWLTKTFNGGKSNAPKRPEATAPALQYSTSLPAIAAPNISTAGATRADILFGDSQRGINADFNRNVLTQINTVVSNESQTRFNYDLTNPAVSQCKSFLGFGCGASGLQKSFTSAAQGFFKAGPIGAAVGFAGGEGSVPASNSYNSPFGNTSIPTTQQSSISNGPVLLSQLETAIMNLFNPQNKNYPKPGFTPPFI